MRWPVAPSHDFIMTILYLIPGITIWKSNMSIIGASSRHNLCLPSEKGTENSLPFFYRISFSSLVLSLSSWSFATKYLLNIRFGVKLSGDEEEKLSDEVETGSRHPEPPSSADFPSLHLFPQLISCCWCNNYHLHQHHFHQWEMMMCRQFTVHLFHPLRYLSIQQE